MRSSLVTDKAAPYALSPLDPSWTPIGAAATAHGFQRSRREGAIFGDGCKLGATRMGLPIGEISKTGDAMLAVCVSAKEQGRSGKPSETR